MINDGKLLTTSEVALYLQIDPITVRRWIKEKKIQAVKIGSLWRFHKNEINRIMEKGMYGK